MAQPGWYTDPDGTPGRLRYWDGAQWSVQTMLLPGAPQVPPQTNPPVMPIHSAGPTPPASPRRGRRLLAGLVAAALGLGLFWGTTSLLGLRAVPGSVSSASTPRPTRFPTTFPPVSNAPVSAPTVPEAGGTASVFPTMPDCPAPTASILTDGTIQVPAPDGWEVATGTDDPWQCEVLASRVVTGEWVTHVIVGSAPAENTDARQFAQELWRWNREVGYPEDASFTVTGVTVGQPEPVTVGGLSGVRLTGAVKVSGLEGVAGDTIQILVLTKADGSFSSLMTVHTTNDAAGEAEIKAVWDNLTVKA